MLAATFADHRAYSRDSTGLVRLLEVTPKELTEKGRLTLPGVIRQPGATFPVVAGGKLYLRDGDRLFCYDIRKKDNASPRNAPREIQLRPLTSRLQRTPNLKGREPNPSGTPDSVYVPTPNDVVDAMLELATPKKDEVLIDLGSGDGRILIAAARKYEMKATGYEIDEDLIKSSRETVKQRGLEQSVAIRKESMFHADLTGASVVVAFQPSRLLECLIPQFRKLKPEARIVTHQFKIPNWEPVKTINVKSRESGNEHTLFLWKSP